MKLPSLSAMPSYPHSPALQGAISKRSRAKSKAMMLAALRRGGEDRGGEEGRREGREGEAGGEGRGGGRGGEGREGEAGGEGRGGKGRREGRGGRGRREGRGGKGRREGRGGGGREGRIAAAMEYRSLAVAKKVYNRRMLTKDISAAHPDIPACMHITPKNGQPYRPCTVGELPDVTHA